VAELESVRRVVGALREPGNCPEDGVGVAEEKESLFASVRCGLMER
jgi:hypothetical protein